MSVRETDILDSSSRETSLKISAQSLKEIREPAMQTFGDEQPKQMKQYMRRY